MEYTHFISVKMEKCIFLLFCVIFVAVKPLCIPYDKLSLRSSIEVPMMHPLNAKISQLRAISIKNGEVDKLDRCAKYIQDCRKRGPGRYGGPIFGVVLRFLNQLAVGVLFGGFIRVFNRLKVNNIDRLLKHVEAPREDGRPLLTISNHQSLMDDPGLWAGVLPWWRIHPDKVRWSLCNEGVFFAVGWLTKFMGAGNVLPLDRSGSLNQPALEYFWEKLNGGAWCHIFPEGRIWQDWRFEEGEPKLGPFMAGVGKVIAHCREGREPIIVPMYHKGMDQIVPEKVLEKKRGGKRIKKSSPRVNFPLTGKRVEVWFGEPFDLKDVVQRFRDEKENKGALDFWDTNSLEALTLYQEIANELRVRMIELESTALGKSHP